MPFGQKSNTRFCFSSSPRSQVERPAAVVINEKKNLLQAISRTTTSSQVLLEFNSSNASKKIASLHRKRVSRKNTTFCAAEILHRMNHALTVVRIKRVVNPKKAIVFVTAVNVTGHCIIALYLVVVRLDIIKTTSRFRYQTAHYPFFTFSSHISFTASRIAFLRAVVKGLRSHLFIVY